jgi:hypothetical protein
MVKCVKCNKEFDGKIKYNLCFECWKSLLIDIKSEIKNRLSVSDNFEGLFNYLHQFINKPINWTNIYTDKNNEVKEKNVDFICEEINLDKVHFILNKSKKVTVRIGEIFMISDDGYEYPIFREVGDIKIVIYPVTVEEYRKFCHEIK